MSQQDLTILVVDDTATNRHILAAFLKKLGFTVLMAEDGEKAVASFVANHPDIILMDVMMPIMDGYEATRQIKKISGERWTPVIFLSALDKEENLVAGLDAGGDDYLHKPVNFVILDAKLRSIRRTLELQARVEDAGRRMAAVTGNLVDGVMVVDPRGRVDWVNPAILEMFGYTQDELLGKSAFMLNPASAGVGEPSAADDFIAGQLAAAEAVGFGRGHRLIEGRRKSGEVFPMELGVSATAFNGEKRYVGVLRDVSARVAAEALLRENAQRLQEYHDVQERENALAQDIVERQMLRAGLSDPKVQHWLTPAANFSGDIVAASRSPDGILYVMLADATGHGLGAAICTLPVLSVFYSLAETGATLAHILKEVNHQLLATMPVGRFVAASLLRIDSAKNHAEIWVGGTPDVLVLDGEGKITRSVAASHLPLGVMEFDDAELASEQLDIDAQTQFMLFSDGLLEASNKDGDQFGFGAMAAALAGAPRDKRVAAIQVALERHLGGLAPHDDVSLLIIDV
jgi:two-component system, HptB-dependent secretion and biofilm response regulator